MIDPKFVVNLKGKDYPLYAGILAEAHRLGLRQITTHLVQTPTPENGNVAIVKATVEMHPARSSEEYDAGWHRFEGYGDASPDNVAKHIVTALIRMAETRAKGRALRDAINCGQTMLEELPDTEETRGEKWQREMPAEKFGAQKAAIVGAEPVPTKVRYSPGTAEGDAAMAGEPRTRTGAETPAACSADGCGAVLTKGQVDVSTQRFGAPLCPAHQKSAAG